MVEVLLLHHSPGNAYIYKVPVLRWPFKMWIVTIPALWLIFSLRSLLWGNEKSSVPRRALETSMKHFQMSRGRATAEVDR